MRYFESEEKGNLVVDLLKSYGYEDVSYSAYNARNDDISIGCSRNRYINLRFDHERGFHMSTVGTWIEGENMQLVVKEAILINEICEKITELLK